jgi:phosphoribosyl 1,2-cyclic phosphodiesterase
LECGISFKDIQKALNFQTSNIIGCLITHEHKDHCKAVNDFVKAGVNCYLSQGTADALEVSGHRIKIVGAKNQFKVGTWDIMPFETEHDAKESLGFLLRNQAGEKLLYATDTYYIKYRFQELTHIMLECNYSLDILNENVAKGVIPYEMKKRLIRSHFSLANVKVFLKANDLSKVSEIHLVHLSDSNSDEVRFKREIQALTGKVVIVAQSN